MGTAKNRIEARMNPRKPVDSGHLTDGGPLTMDVIAQHDECATCRRPFKGTRTVRYCSDACAAVGRQASVARANERARRKRNAK